VIALHKVRLVGWHYFDDVLIPIGEATLLAGDNGSGKSTVIDAIQYALAANLTRIRFNAAASEKKAGRTLEAYVRGKTGLESGEYLRDDAVAHVMLQFTVDGLPVSAGICVEAFKDEVQVREYPWIADIGGIETVVVRDEEDRSLSGRVFRDLMRASSAMTFDSKREYNAELTHRLGVFKRNAEFNPYLDAVVRSVSFSPLSSVDKFVCDYILDDRPVDVSAMKANLESYKEAEREAEAAVRKIESLSLILKTAGEWAQFERLLVLQGYLKVRVDAESAAARKERLEHQSRDFEREVSRATAAIERLIEEKARLETSRRDAESALARDDAYLLVRGLRDKRETLVRDLTRSREKAERWELLRGQCAALLDRPLGGKKSAGFDADASWNADAELAAIDEERASSAAARARLDTEVAALSAAIEDAAAELAELEKGTPRYPAASTRLRAELAAHSIEAWIFADLVEVDEPEWRNAVEGWLNTLRFAVLVEPGHFREALGVYDALPREVAGVALPNLEKMRGAAVRPASLAPTLATDSPYARIYADFVLGDVMRAGLDTLKDFEKSVTKECMSYSRHTATRMKEDTYSRWYLGRAAREKRMAELRTELDRLRAALREQGAEAKREAEREDALRRAYGGIHEMKGLTEARDLAAALPAELAAMDAEIKAVDLSGARGLEATISGFARAIARAEADAARETEGRGKAVGALEGIQRDLEEAERVLTACRSAFESYMEGRENLRGEFEAYYAERVAGSDLGDIAANYESSAKGTRTRMENAAQTYRKQVQEYNGRFNALLSLEPSLADEAAAVLRRYEDSELPLYREKIAKARSDAERQFKEHFVARLNEYIDEARESFAEINETLKALSFGRDQYRFTLEERSDRRGQLEVIRKAAEINLLEGSLFAALATEAERRAVEALFERILRNDLDSFEVRAVCDYRTYFTYDIKLRDLTAIDSRTGKPPEFSLSKVIREKSGGEAQTPYYVAIAASFYRFYKDDPEHTIRLVLFDEAFNRMDDERIGKALELFRRLRMQVVTAVPTEKLETVAPHMDAICLVVRHGYNARIYDFRGTPSEAPEHPERPGGRSAERAPKIDEGQGVLDPTLDAIVDGE
jgi:uncharacterized protein YPO0396